MRARDPLTVDVVIAGAGIAGAAMAAALRGSGLRVLLLEKSSAPLDTARGDHLQPGTLEILARWGVLDALVAQGAEQRSGSVWFDHQGERLFQSTVADLDLPYPFYLYLNHERIGAALLDAALEDPNIRIERPIRNWWPAGQEADGLRLRVGRTDGTELLVRAGLLIGADGRSSRVRGLFEFDATSYRYERPIAVLFGRPAARDAANNLEVHLGERQMVAVIPRTGGDCKIGIPIAAPDAGKWRRASGEELTARLKTLVPHRDFGGLRFADVYPPVYLRADRWAKDNVVLIGDACHAMHPARSQGMNTAIRCVDALADALKTAGTGLSPAVAKDLAMQFETGMKPAVDVMLEKNHGHGLEMDRSDPANYRQTCASLSAVRDNPELSRAFALSAAGYPPRT